MDIQKLIYESGRDFGMIARHLFSENKHPDMALRRVASGAGELSESQVKQFCALCFISITEYYADSVSKKHKTFIRTENATGVYDSDTKALSIYKADKAYEAHTCINTDTKLSHVIEVINSF